MKVTAILRTTNGNEIQKDFDVEMRDEGRLYSQELVNWVVNEKCRIGNMFTIRFNGKEYLYSI